MSKPSRASRRNLSRRVIVPVTLSFALAACNGGGSTDTPAATTVLDAGGDVTSVSNQDAAAPVTSDATSDAGAAPALQPTADAQGGQSGGTDTNTAAVIASLTSVGVAGKTYFVATNGDDGNNGLSLDRPMRTIERAMSLVNPGDTIEVRAGTYSSGAGFVARRAGTTDARIKIKAYNNEKVTLTSGAAQVFYVVESAPYWIVEGFEIRGGSSYALKIDAHHVNAVRNNMHGSGADIVKLVSTSDDVVLYANEIHSNNASTGANAQGVDIVGADRTWVAHNFVHDTASIGIYSKGNSRNSLFENNRLVNIRSRGLMLGQSTGTQFMNDGRYETYDGIIRNNIVINSADACLASASSYNVKIYNNSCYNAATTSHGGIYLSNESSYGQAGTNVEIRNNVVVTAGRPVVKVNGDAMTDFSTLKIDNNVFWSTSGNVSFMWNGGTVSWDSWRAMTGHDGASKVANPQYSSTSTLVPAANSPVVDAGATVGVATTRYNAYASPGVREDYNHTARPKGAAIDIGAYEVN